MIELIKSIHAHNDKVWSVSSHSRLPLLVTASTDKTSNIYKLSKKYDFPLINRLQDTHTRSIRSVAFKPPLGGSDHPVTDYLDLPALASGSFDSTISVWGIDEPNDDLDDEEILENQKQILTSIDNDWNLMAIIEGHENEIKAVDWNYDGSYIASCSRDKTVWIWETDPETLEEFECISVLNDHEHDVKNVTWHPSLNMLASSSYDDTIRVYMLDDDEDDWSCVGVLNGHEGTVWNSKFENFNSPNAQTNRIRLVSVSDDKTVRIWSTFKQGSQTKANTIPSSIKHTSELVWEQDCILPQTHKYPIYSVAWSKTSGKIATVGSDSKLVVYKEVDNQWCIEFEKDHAHGIYEINSVIWANLDDDTEVLITAGDDGNVNIWSI